MGEDIHFRCYVRSKKTGGYINAHDICSWNPEYSIFKELVEGRNYDLFSLFGSRRGNYGELPGGHYGLPDFVKGTVFDDYCRERGYYGFVWFKLPELAAAVKEYADRLKNPFEYYKDDDDRLAEWTDIAACAFPSPAVDPVVVCRDRPPDTTGLVRFMTAYREWLDEHRNILDRLAEITDRLEQYTSVNDYDCTYSKLVDIDETVFLFFFDN